MRLVSRMFVGKRATYPSSLPAITISPPTIWRWGISWGQSGNRACFRTHKSIRWYDKNLKTIEGDLFMQLLIQRGQGKTIVLRRPNFKLWAKFELTPEEAALINKYQVHDHVLVEGIPGQLRKAMIISGVLGVFVWGLFAPQAGFGDAILILLSVFAVGSFVIYHNIREQIRVRDILNGRF